MEELLYKLEKFFPLTPADGLIKKYLAHHYNNLLKCIENQLYSSGFYHLHLIYMMIIYFQIERILETMSHKELRYSLIGFDRYEKRLYKESENEELLYVNDLQVKARNLSVLNEKTVLRFFRIIISNDEIVKDVIKNISHLIDYRNETFHAKPSATLLEDEKIFIRKLEEYINSLEKIINESIEFLEKLYKPILPLFKESTLTEDDLVIQFGIFSLYELTVLAKKNKDTTSKQILEIIGPR